MVIILINGPQGHIILGPQDHHNEIFVDVGNWYVGSSNVDHLCEVGIYMR